METIQELIKRKQYERETIWNDCICGNRKVHSKECRRNHRRKYLKKFVSIRREERHKLRKEHKCIICKRKVKPKIIYHQFCGFHKKQQDEYNKNLKQKLKGAENEKPE